MSLIIVKLQTIALLEHYGCLFYWFTEKKSASKPFFFICFVFVVVSNLFIIYLFLFFHEWLIDKRTCVHIMRKGKEWQILRLETLHLLHTQQKNTYTKQTNKKI